MKGFLRSLFPSPERLTKALVGKSASGGLATNILALYGVHIANYLFPLLTVPYLARVLGPKEWGLLAFAQAFGGYLQLLVEFGFSLSATRQVARARDSLRGRAELLASVLGAKAFLGLLAIGVALLVGGFIPAFRDHPQVLWAGVFWALATAFSPVLYFQGLERMRLVAGLEVLAKGLVLLLLFLWVKGPSDTWKVLALQGGASLLATLLALYLAYREVPLFLPTLKGVLEALRLGWSMFFFRSAVSLYTLGNTFILGLFAPPQVVGYYAGAEKISKAVLGLLSPVSQALYPRLSHLVRRAPAEAARLARLGLWTMGLSGLFLGLLVFALAPFLVRLFLGEGYDPAVLALRLLAFLVPLIALSNVLGIQWMLPLGLDRPFNAIIVGAGLFNLGLALLLAPRLFHVGMALAVVVSELFVTLGMWLYLKRSRQDPFAFQGGGQ
ncbi:flippase [Thermus scotoductus]|uniref:O-antigen transporter n=1 Tax=Thermus scotoductus (strain ATCC 700910 / SA-01) TaxID=743525 RepID=E8PKF8_THESS|nr:flippase [Thermus scotoductus]ADW20930.1 O-antigen transporter [Thermus scotoductus SA-01]